MAETIGLDKGQLAAIEKAVGDLKAANVASKAGTLLAREALQLFRRALADRSAIRDVLGIDVKDPENERRLDTLEGAVNGLVAGVQAGSRFGPVGAVTGAIGGAAAGGIFGHARQDLARRVHEIRTSGSNANFSAQQDLERLKNDQKGREERFTEQRREAMRRRGGKVR